MTPGGGSAALDRNRTRIATLQERTLHSAIKEWYRRPGDRLEQVVDGYVIDLVRRGLLIEIQTAGFSAIKRKLTALVEGHNVRLVHPIAAVKTLLRLSGDGSRELGRRKSPKQGTLIDLFPELVSIPHLIPHRRFTLEILLIHEEEVRLDDGRGSWRKRKGWSIHDRRLLEVVGVERYRTPRDFLRFLPPGLIEPFTSRDLAESAGIPHYLAQKMTYCLRHMGALYEDGKRRNARLYRVSG